MDIKEPVKPYSAYKPSGVPWLGGMPEHWDKEPFKYNYKVSMGQTILATDLQDDGELPVISATEENHYFGRISSPRFILKPGDLVIPARGVSIGAVKRVVEPSVCTQTTIYAKHCSRRNIDSSYVFYFLSGCRTWLFEYDRTAIPQLTVDQVRNNPTLLPPLSEQAAIVCFLDHADRRIRRYIRAKEQLINLLEEQKQTIIHQAVTGQIDVRTGQPYLAYKNSGVEWLGKVPRHWEVRRLRHLIEGKLSYGANAAAEYTNREWPRYLRITDFARDGRLRSDTFRSLPPEIAKDFLVIPGDVLLARSGATVGKAFLVRNNSGGACHAGYLIRARPNRTHLLPGFLFAFTQSIGFRRWKDLTLIIATIQNIGADKYAGLKIPTPPVVEQQWIVQFIDTEVEDLDRAAKRAATGISLLGEYRTRLIADVVTGKLDVRAAAERLLDNFDEMESTGGTPHGAKAKTGNGELRR